MRGNHLVVALSVATSLTLVGCIKTPRYKDCTITIETDSNGDGTSDATTLVEYNSDRQLFSKVTDTFTVIEGTVYPVVITTSYEYNAGYFPTKITTVTEVAGTTSTSIATHTYADDDENQIALSETDVLGDGSVIATSKYTWTDDTVNVESDNNGDGITDLKMKAVKYWFPLFFPPILPTSVDGNADGADDLTYTNTFNDDDFIATVVRHDENGQSPDITSTYTYDEDHNLLEIASTYDGGSSTTTFSGPCFE